MDDASRCADLHTAENLIACYVRDIASPRGEARWTGEEDLVIALPLTGRVIRARTSRPSLVQSFELIEGPDLDGAAAGALAIYAALEAEAAARFDCSPHPELRGLVENSRAVLARLLAGRRPAVDAPGFLPSEQALTFGHPHHPSPKARVGFDAADLDRYSPELGAAFPLHLFAVSADRVIEESLDGPADALVAAALGEAPACPPGFVLLPAHPWQARSALESGILERLLRAGEVIDLGPSGPPWFATSSVRTLYRPGSPFFLKASLGVRITNCLRRNATHEMRCSVQVSRWMRPLRPALSELAPSFTPLDEVAFRTLDPGEGDPAERASLEELFGFLLRDAVPVRAAAPAAEPRVAASLFGDRGEGRARLDAALPAGRREAWFQGYLSSLVSPCLWLFFQAGLMFEPHLQNVLAGGLSGEGPVPVLLRDYDNAKVVEGIAPPEMLSGLLPEVVGELLYPAEESWERFVYCLFTNNLAEVAGTLSGGDEATERRLWGMVRAHLEDWQSRFGDGRSRPRITALLRREGLPAKANFLTRVFKQKDRDAPFTAVPNPLSG